MSRLRHLLRLGRSILGGATQYAADDHASAHGKDARRQWCGTLTFMGREDD
jgi:hypothetical protein